MKPFRFIMIALMAAPLFLASCGTKNKVDKNLHVVSGDTIGRKEFMHMVHATSTLKTPIFSSKVKFILEVGPQHISLTGNLRMLRDDVIRLQLMAFGFVEAGRMEFTKEEVLIIDRINKQYMRMPYKYIDFLRNSGINFYTLQALFWNELFIPGNEGVRSKDLDKFSTDLGGDEAVIHLDRGELSYSWLVNQESGRIKMANIMYRDPIEGNTLLNWNYNSLGALNGQLFPNDMVVTLKTPKKEIKMSMKLNYMGTDSNWEPRSTVSEKYHEVSPDELLRRIMASF